MYFDNLFLTVLLWAFLFASDTFELYLILKINRNDPFYIKKEIYYATYIIDICLAIVCVLLHTPFDMASMISALILWASLFLAINERSIDRFWAVVTVTLFDIILTFIPEDILKYGFNLDDSIITILGPALVNPFLILIYFIKYHTGFFDRLMDKYSVRFIKYILLISAFFQCIGATLVVEVKPQNLYLTIMFLIFALLLCTVTLYILNIHRKITKLSAEQKVLLTAQKEYYLALLEKEEETRKYRHDMNNHLMCLSALVETENIPEIRDYLSNLQNQFRSVNDSVYQTGNTILTAITAHYIPMADENTKVTITGKLTKDLDLSNTDLCTVYSNLIKNSIEELQRIDKSVHKELNIRFDTGNHFGKICVSNSMKDPSAFKGLASKTVKEDNKNHGFGIQNINQVVAKNKGTFDIKKENDQFCCEVVLPTVSVKAS